MKYLFYEQMHTCYYIMTFPKREALNLQGPSPGSTLGRQQDADQTGVRKLGFTQEREVNYNNNVMMNI